MSGHRATWTFSALRPGDVLVHATEDDVCMLLQGKDDWWWDVLVLSNRNPELAGTVKPSWLSKEASVPYGYEIVRNGQVILRT